MWLGQAINRRRRGAWKFNTKTAHAEVVKSWDSRGGENGRDRFDFENDRVPDGDLGAKAQWNRYYITCK
jgi:hypothetical protein